MGQTGERKTQQVFVHAEQKQDKEEKHQKVLRVKQEKEKLQHTAVFLVVEAAELEKRQAGVTTTFAVRVAIAAVLEREKVLKTVEYHICFHPENDTIVFVPYSHVMCSKCMLEHRMKVCHSCCGKVTKLTRMHR